MSSSNNELAVCEGETLTVFCCSTGGGVLCVCRYDAVQHLDA